MATFIFFMANLKKKDGNINTIKWQKCQHVFMVFEISFVE